MTTDQRSPRRRSANEAADAIRAATLELLAERGFAAVTTDEIASRAGVSKATIYRNWRTKQELVADAAGRRIPRGGVADHGDFAFQLRTYLEARRAEYGGEGAFTMVASLLGHAADDQEMRRNVEAWVADLQQGLRRMIERAQARGEVRSDVGVDTLVSLISSPQLFRLLVEMRAPDDRFGSELLQVLLVALAPPDAPEPGG